MFWWFLNQFVKDMCASIVDKLFSGRWISKKCIKSIWREVMQIYFISKLKHVCICVHVPHLHALANLLKYYTYRSKPRCMNRPYQTPNPTLPQTWTKSLQNFIKFGSAIQKKILKDFTFPLCWVPRGDNRSNFANLGQSSYRT